MGKKIQATSYNCARTVFELYEYLGTKKKSTYVTFGFLHFLLIVFISSVNNKDFLDVFAFLTALITLKVV